MKRLFFLLLPIFPLLANCQLLRLAGIADAAPIAISITGSFFAFTNQTGSPSSSQFVGVAGTGLTNPINIPIPTGFEGSPDNATWVTTSVTYTLTGGSVTGQSFYLRVKSTTTAQTISGNAVASSSPANPVNIAYSATINPIPAWSASPTSISGMTDTIGAAGTPVIDTLTFVGTLGNSITVSTTGPFEASVDGGVTYGTSWGITTGSPYKVRARIASTAPVGSASGTLKYTCTACGLAQISVPLSGTVSTAGSSSDTARFAMSASSQTVPAGFVSFFGDPSTGVRTAVNQAGNITISTVSTANWSAVSGSCANDADGLTGSTVAGFPDNVLKAQHFTYSGSTHTVDSANQGLGKPNYTISGLNSSATYHIEITASLSGTFGLSCNNKYYALGAGTLATIGTNPAGGQTLNASANTSQKIVFSSVTPSASGTINIYLFTVSGQELNIAGAIATWKN